MEPAQPLPDPNWTNLFELPDPNSVQEPLSNNENLEILDLTDIPPLIAEENDQEEDEIYLIPKTCTECRRNPVSWMITTYDTMEDVYPTYYYVKIALYKIEAPLMDCRSYAFKYYDPPRTSIHFNSTNSKTPSKQSYSNDPN